jgi:hypothetical protein
MVTERLFVRLLFPQKVKRVPIAIKSKSQMQPRDVSAEQIVKAALLTGFAAAE